MATLTYFLLSSVFVYASANIVVYPMHYDEEQKLAARINCRIGESRNFRYSSSTNLWGKIQGQIDVNCDVAVYCLGNDDDGRYGEEGLKYVVELANLVITERSHDNPSQRLTSLASTRSKRSFKDFVKETWGKFKRFFSRMFGGSSDDERTEEPKTFDTGRRESEDEAADDNKDETSTRKPAEEADEGPHTMNYESLWELPFEFVQLADGSIPEVRFAEEESDTRVRNFKRHVVDTFATQFNTKPEMTKETSVIGEHLSNYSITVSSPTSQPIQLAGAHKGPLTYRGGENHVLVEKFITEDQILSLAPNRQNEALNDKDKMDLKAEQSQVFVRGKLVSSTGKSWISLFDSSEKKRMKRSADDDEDVMSLMQIQSEFQLKVEKRKRRSVSQDEFQMLQGKSMKYAASSRYAEPEDSSAKQKLRDLQQSVGNTTAFVINAVENPPTNEEKMQILFALVEEEVRYGMDHERHSMAAAVRKILSEEKVLPMCRKDFNRCRNFLQLLALAGESEAEKVLLACFSDQRLNLLSRQQVADIFSEVSNPSREFLSSLLAHLERGALKLELYGTLCLSAATIASQSPEQHLKSKMARILISGLETELANSCSTSVLIFDLLEAVGNLGHEDTADYVLKVSSDCSDQKEIQIACAHAFRHLSSLPKVRQWIMKAIDSGPCDLKRAVLGSLMDRIAFQENTRDNENWPRYGFNDIDQAISEGLNSQCAREDRIRYFRKKKSDKAKEIADNYFSEESEHWNPGTESRQKRDLWDKLNCKEWTEDAADRPIQDKEEFESDKAIYNRRKSCLASRKLGIRGANAEIYAGMFAGVKDPKDDENPQAYEYKLFTKFVSAINFFGHELEIGSFSVYLRNGTSKVYSKLRGKTKQEFTNEGCTPTELSYRPIVHVPLFHLTISSVQLSLGLHLSAQLALNTKCPGAEGTDKYSLQPFSNVRVGAEAQGSVLFVRGSLALGGNFNYHLLINFAPYPDMCLDGQHGYDPMTIGLEAYYQLWNTLKNDWGKNRIWRPKFMNWQLRNGQNRTWFDRTCVFKLPAEKLVSNGATTVSDENSIGEFVQ